MHWVMVQSAPCSSPIRPSTFVAAAVLSNGEWSQKPNRIKECGYLLQKILFCILHIATACVLSERENI